MYVKAFNNVFLEIREVVGKVVPILSCRRAFSRKVEKGEYLSSTLPHSPNPLPLCTPSKLCKYWEKEKIREKVAQVANLCHLSLPL